MDDGYSVQQTAAESAETGGLDTLQALKDADTFLVADNWGDLKGGADGLFDHDTRILSRFVMTVGMARPSRLSSGVSKDNVFFTAHTTNRPLPPMGGRSAPAGVLHLERRRFVWDRRMFERVRMVNHGVEDVLLPLAFDFGADFADIFQVRGTLREKRGTSETPTHDGRRITFRYTGLDGVLRTSCLSFSEPPARLTGTRAEFMFSLPKGKELDLYIECGAEACDQPDARRWRANAVAARLGDAASAQARGLAARPPQPALQRLAGPVTLRHRPADHRPADGPLSLCRDALVLDAVRARRDHMRLADAVARPVAGQGRADLPGQATGDGGFRLPRIRHPARSCMRRAAAR